MRTIEEVCEKMISFLRNECEPNDYIDVGEMADAFDEILEINKANESVNGDLISRSALKKAISKSTCHWSEHMWRQVVCDVIDNQPTVYNNGWIPCSERLPEYTDEYNVTVGVPNEFGYYEKVTTLRFERIKGKEPRWITPKEEIYIIIAWQPLPPDYQPKGENNGI